MKMINRNTLWDIWFLMYLIVINSFLAYNAISNYISFKSNSLDLQYGKNWDMNLVHLIMECIIIPLALLPIIVYTNIIPQGNLPNDKHILGKSDDYFRFVLNENGKPSIVLTNKAKFCGCKNQLIRLIHMETPPTSYLLNVVAAYVYLIPKPFMDAKLIFHQVLKPNHIWHTDLDMLFDPDKQHKEFTHFDQWSFLQPMSVAYFNLGFSLFILSIKYAQVFWNVSRTFALVLSFIMLVFTVHILVEYSAVSVIIKITENPLLVASSLRLKINSFTVQFLSIVANLILVFSFTTIFHYGILQYGDIMVHRNRRIRRQIMSSSQQMIGSNQLDLPGPFSPCASENNYSESSIEPVFSKSHLSHILAISFLLIIICFKTPFVYLSFKHLYHNTSDSLTFANMFIGCLFIISWLIIWFAFALRRTWNFKIKTSMKSNIDPILMNGNSLLNNTGHMQLHQMQNSFLLNPKTSELNISKQEMMTINRNAALDGCSDETDMSSKLSCNNYVSLQSMRNGNMGYDLNTHASLLRNPLYLSCIANNPNIINSNIVYTNDDSLNMCSTHLEDQLGSEHSYNSSRSRNLGFEILPPILPNFDENRYKNFNQNSAAMDKLIPRYLRQPSLDLNRSLQLSGTNSDLINSSSTSTTMSYNFDNNLQNYNNRFKQGSLSGSQMRSPEKFSNLHNVAKNTIDQVDFLSTGVDDEGGLLRRQFVNGDAHGRSSMDSIKRIVKSPVIFQTVEENITGDTHPNEQNSFLPTFNNINVLDIVSNSGNISNADMKTNTITTANNNNNNNINNNNNNNNNGNVNNNNNSNNPNDRLCSQV